MNNEEIRDNEKINLRRFAKLTDAPFMRVCLGHKDRPQAWHGVVPGWNDYSFDIQSNVAVVLRGLVCQDFESNKAFLTYYNPNFPLENDVVVVKSPKGWHVFRKGTTPYLQIKDDETILMEVRSGNQYMITGSSWVNGKQYQFKRIPETLAEYDAKIHNARLEALGWIPIFAEEWTKTTQKTKGRMGDKKGLFDLVKVNISIADVTPEVDRRGPKTQYVWCPFHNDKKPDGSPSLRVRLETNVFFCFSCGARGGAIDMFAKRHGLTPMDSAVELANMYNL
jgi:hypothetical protein